MIQLEQQNQTSITTQNLHITFDLLNSFVSTLFYSASLLFSQTFRVLVKLKTFCRLVTQTLERAVVPSSLRTSKLSSKTYNSATLLLCTIKLQMSDISTLG